MLRPRGRAGIALPARRRRRSSCSPWPFRFYLGRYEMVYNEHGTFLVGIDYVDQNIGLPLQWLVIVACLAAAVFVWMGRWLRCAGLMALSLVLDFVAPGRGERRSMCGPTKSRSQRPYIQTHIHATRSAFGIDTATFKEIEFKAKPEAPIDVAAPQAHPRQRAPLGLARLPRHRHADPGAAPLLRVRRHRRGPLHHRRPVLARCC